MNNFIIVKPDPNDDRSDGIPNNEQYHHNQENHHNQTHK